MNHNQQQLLKSSNYITAILSQLKSSINEASDSSSCDDNGIDAIQYIEKAIDLRTTFRVLVDGIQANRSLVQIQKQQIEKKKMYLQGLHYYKATLKSQITQSQLELVDVNDYMDYQEQKEGEKKIDWIDGYNKQEEKLITAMDCFKQRKEEMKMKYQRKLEINAKLNQSQEKATKALPQQLKKLHSQLLQTTKLFNIKEIDPIALTEFKSKKIQKIHSILFPLKVKEMIDLKHTIGDQEEEIQVTIQKGWCGEWYEYARKNKIMVEDRQFKFTISSLYTVDPTRQTLVLSISRREEFTVQQIFNNLLLQESVKPIYENPKSEMEINFNIKYVKLDWIADVLGSNSCMISGIKFFYIKGKMFIDRVKERIFSLTLVKYALENVTKKVPTYFFPLFNPEEQGSKLTIFPILDNKKILFTKCEKSEFQEYKQEVYIPEWVLKALNNQKILIQELKSSKSSNQSSVSLTEKKLLSSFIESNHLEDLEEKNVYEYYRFEVVIEKSLLTGFFLIPIDYPKRQNFEQNFRKSIVKLINFKKATENHHNLHVPKHSEMKTQKFEDDETRIFTEELKNLQVELNEKINVFFLTPVSNGQLSTEEIRKRQPFFIYFQINRLISLLVEKSFPKN